MAVPNPDRPLDGPELSWEPPSLRAIAMIVDGFSNSEIEATTGLGNTRIEELRKQHKSMHRPFYN